MNLSKERPSGLLALPAEIRLLIYKYVFEIPAWTRHRISCKASARDAACTHCGPCSILNELRNPPLYPPARFFVDQPGMRYRPWRTAPMGATSKCCPEWPSIIASWPGERTAILRTSKAIYEEARDVLYNNTLYAVRVSFCAEYMRKALNISYPWYGASGTIAIAIASQLQHCRNLAVELQIHSGSDMHSFIPYLAALADVLPATERLKSKTITLNFEGIERFMPFSDLHSAPWEGFARAVSQVASDTELRLVAGPRWAEHGKAENELLAKAVVGRIKFLRSGKSLCEGSTLCSPLH